MDGSADPAVFTDTKNYIHNLEAFYKNNKNTGDVVLLVGDEDISQCTPVRAFRVLLSAQSAVFRAMFFGAMKEADHHHCPTVHIPNIDAETMAALVEYCHTGSVRLDLKIAFPLLAAADQYQLEALKEACAASIQRDLSLDNCCEMLQYSHHYKVTQLEERCLQFFEKHAEAVLSQPKFLDLPVETLLVVLERNLRLSEIEIFKRVMVWAHHNHYSKEDMDPVMRKLRFPLISAKDLVSIVKPTNMVPLDLYLEAIEFHATSTADNMDSIQFQPRGALFTWVADKKANISEDGLTVSKSSDSTNGWNLLVQSNKEFSEGKPYWELTLDCINSDQSGMVIGVVWVSSSLLVDLVQAPTGHAVSAYESSVALGMAGSVYNTRLVGPRDRIKQGDRIGVGLDFSRKLVSFYHNGQYFACGEIKWSKVRAVVFLFYPKNQVTLSFPVKSFG